MKYDHLMVSRGSVSIGAGIRLALHADVEGEFYEKFMVFSLGTGLRISVESFGLGLVGEYPRNVSGWYVWVRSRLSPDGGLSVVQFYRGFVSGSLLFGEHYILGFDIKFSELRTRVWLIGLRAVPGCVLCFSRLFLQTFNDVLCKFIVTFEGCVV